ncbi:MAG: EI24 domain-containing protein [Thermodesulfobacteriota bacterium]
MDNSSKQNPPPARWIPLSHSLAFLLRSPRLLGWSIALMLITFGLTWLGYHLTVDFVDQLTGSFFLSQPEASGIWGWSKYLGWEAMRWSFLFISRIVSFYLAFLLAYSLSAPGYVFLSTAAEKRHAGETFETEAAFNVKGLLIDLWEGGKIAGFGIVVAVAALMANFIPGVGQVVVFLLYTYYSALMFVDYPSSRRRWSLGKKINWLRCHKRLSFRLGLLPALLSMVPVINIFFIALIFPLMTVHSTLNFVAVEEKQKKSVGHPSVIDR